MEIIIGAGALVIGLLIGIAIGRYLLMSLFKKDKEDAEKEALNIIKEARLKAEAKKLEADTVMKEKLLEAKEKAQNHRQKLENDLNQRRSKVSERENTLKQKTNTLAQRTEEVKRKEKEVKDGRETITKHLEIIDKKKAELDQSTEQHVKKLEAISGYSADEAKAELISSLEESARSQAMATIKEIVDEAKNTANKEARKIIIQSIQRTAAEQTIENTVSVFKLESDEIKGQIIGREGRNIRALEAATGVEIIVDDTPEAIVISGFDSVRREVCRLSLQKLVTDGRIHPARIEEVVRKTSKQIEDQITEIGERTVIELGITGLHPQLIRMVGRMRYRSSYGQNLLMHSKETANLCALMAAELGLNPKLAKRAGLLHDIGKVYDEESELTHALVGMKLCEKYKEHPAVCNAVGAHHDEIEMSFIISPIVQACDAISGARPGARREIMESYLKRIKALEDIAIGYKGVQKAYAIQAGRELRVLVESDKVTDERSDQLAFEISQQIQNEMQYPGQIKVTVIREKRAIGLAR